MSEDNGFEEALSGQVLVGNLEDAQKMSSDWASTSLISIDNRNCIDIAGYLIAIGQGMCRDKMKFKKSFEVWGWAGNSVLGTDNTVLVQYVQYGYNSVKCLSKIELNVIRIKRRSVSFQFGVQLIPEITQERANQLERNYIIPLSERKARVDKCFRETTYPT